jgi:catechol 2,3-dioxygenase-like lactoylglutathione lyase family enzyme
VEILGLAFAGLVSPESDALASFLRDVLGLEPATDEHGTMRFTLGNGDGLAVVPGELETRLGFLVADVEAAVEELRARGIEPDGELSSGAGMRWQHVRAPDGRLFELVDRRG